ncbi:MAG: efflux RND transporter periplasmic adaptor subunit [Desulfomonilaceae bacterium]
MRVKHFVKLFFLVLVPLAALSIFANRFLHSGKDEMALFRTVPVKQGDLLSTITATGVVEPEEVVDVGAQVAGRIVAFGKDASGRRIDYGSVVEEGMVLARIDDALYVTDVATAKAQLDSSKTGVLRAEADLRQLQARLYQTERDWSRAKKLGPSDALSYADYDAAQSAYEMAKANVEVGIASIAQAKDAVAQAAAGLRKAQQNLDYCTIKSPVNGVIIDRRVNIGQTVVASLNAPSLFLIAKDLRRLQVWISVNEADIGNIRPGQQVTFTVDAFSGQAFRGEVGKIRLNANMTQNVVTYTVEVITDNSDGKLLPYLTANAKFLMNQRNKVLMVPNAALRWSPKPEQIAPGSSKHSGSQAGDQGLQPRSPLEEGSQKGSAIGVVWGLDGNFVRPFTVAMGPTDGSMTEIQSEKIQEGMLVVVGERSTKSSGRQTAASPFAPQFSTKGGGGGH